MVVFGLDDAVILKERTAKLHLISIPRKGQCIFFVKAGSNTKCKNMRNIRYKPFGGIKKVEWDVRINGQKVTHVIGFQ